MGVAGRHQLQMPAVTRQPLINRPRGRGEPLMSQPTDRRAGRTVVQRRVQDDVEDLIEKHQPAHVGGRGLALPLGDQVPGPGVGPGEGLVEQLHHLVDDLGVRRRQRGQQHRVAPVRVHVPHRARSGTARHGGELPQPLRRHRGQVQPVSTEVAQVCKLADLGLDRLRRGGGGAGAQPGVQPRYG